MTERLSRLRPVPTPDAQTSLRALRALLEARNPLAAMQIFHEETGDIFRIQLPGFSPIVLAGPQAAHFVLVDSRDELRWRNEDDPITRLLRHGLLVEDGDPHDRLRRLMSPPLHKRMLSEYLDIMWRTTDQVLDTWNQNEPLDMLVEMRKITLLILTRTLFRDDFYHEMQQLWDSVLVLTRYISPGIWLFWKDIPRPGYRRAIQQMDEYLYRIIALRRREMERSPDTHGDLLSVLVNSNLTDDLIRDQLVTMLIAGHDTGTAMLAWTLYLLGEHPVEMKLLQKEIAALPVDPIKINPQLNNLDYLEQVIRESLRLYPPVHMGSRLAAKDLNFKGYHIPEGDRVVYSIYLTQRHKDFWEHPHQFDPQRHKKRSTQTPYAWLAFGGGPRNCIGAAFGLIEAKVILTRIIQRFNLQLVSGNVRLHMGATLEPHPGVLMRVKAL